MKALRLLLLPISWLYSIVLSLRHWLYDTGIFKTNHNFGVPVICVGNLNLGGTGKTPFTEYLIDRLSTDLKIGVLSRGYGRETKGYILADVSSTADQIGDEPLQIFEKNSYRISLAVCEDRASGIRQLLEDKKHLQLIILDDAFQHRKVSADINILLTPTSDPYFKDFLIPAGNLRDVKSAAKRADHIIFTKTDPGFKDQVQLRSKLSNKHRDSSWFSYINYQQWKYASSNLPVTSIPKEILVVTGIAKPQYFLDHIESVTGAAFNTDSVQHIEYPDHHKYSDADIEEMASLFDTFAGAEKAILTTEKDWVKLSPLVESHRSKDHWVVAPISFQLENEDTFLASLKHKIAASTATTR